MVADSGVFDNNETVSHMYDSAFTATEKQSRVIVVSSLFIYIFSNYSVRSR